MDRTKVEMIRDAADAQSACRSKTDIMTDLVVLWDAYYTSYFNFAKLLE